MKSACLFPCFSYASIRIWILFSYISSVASSFILMRSLKYHYEQNVNAAVKSFHAHAKRYLYFSFVSNLYLSMKIFWKYSYNAKILYNLSAKRDNSLWKKFNTASLSARADNLLSGRIDFLPCLKKLQPFIYKRIARKCVEHIDLPALILNLHQLLHHLTTHLLADLQLQFQFIFPLFQQFRLQVFYCFQ